MTVARWLKQPMTERLAHLDTLGRAAAVNQRPVEQRPADGPNGYVTDVARRDDLDGARKQLVLDRERRQVQQELAALRHHFDEAVSRCRRWVSDAQLECIARQRTEQLAVEDIQERCMPRQLYEAVFMPGILRSAVAIGGGGGTSTMRVARAGAYAAGGAGNRARRRRKRTHATQEEGAWKPVTPEDTKALARESAASLRQEQPKRHAAAQRRAESTERRRAGAKGDRGG